ncbi:MAG: hypothetical protein J6S71_05645 [Clostridia bacterium]|nr:hypothetical protein [Clostridia bacterium]
MKRHIVSCLAILMCLIISLSSCDFSKPLRTKMQSYYSDDTNYVTLSGIVASMSDDGRKLGIKITTENHGITHPKLEDIYEFHVFFEDDEAWVGIELNDPVTFTTAPMYFYNGHILPIVFLAKDGEVYLELEDGKAQLLTWVENDGFDA